MSLFINTLNRRLQRHINTYEQLYSFERLVYNEPTIRAAIEHLDTLLRNEIYIFIFMQPCLQNMWVEYIYYLRMFVNGTKAMLRTWLAPRRRR